MRKQIIKIFNKITNLSLVGLAIYRLTQSRFIEAQLLFITFVLFEIKDILTEQKEKTHSCQIGKNTYIGLVRNQDGAPYIYENNRNENDE